MRVLIVEDLGFIRHSLELLLKKNGFDALHATSGKRAVEILREDNQIAAVITKINLPEMNGIDLFRESQRIEYIDDSGAISGPKFILTTKKTHFADQKMKTELEEKLRKIGFACVLYKPIDQAQLISQLRKIENDRVHGREKEPDQITEEPKPPPQLIS